MASSDSYSYCIFSSCFKILLCKMILKCILILFVHRVFYGLCFWSVVPEKLNLYFSDIITCLRQILKVTLLNLGLLYNKLADFHSNFVRYGFIMHRIVFFSYPVSRKFIRYCIFSGPMYHVFIPCLIRNIFPKVPWFFHKDLSCKSRLTMDWSLVSYSLEKWMLKSNPLLIAESIAVSWLEKYQLTCLLL